MRVEVLMCERYTQHYAHRLEPASPPDGTFMVYLENIFNGMGVLTSMPSVAVLIPCFNESATIQAVINDFRAQLPHAVVYVCDNTNHE